MVAAVNPLDNMIIRGAVKLIVPYKVPLIMGNEFSGVVEKTGKRVARFKAGRIRVHFRGNRKSGCDGDRALPDDFY